MSLLYRIMHLQLLQVSAWSNDDLKSVSKNSSVLMLLYSFCNSSCTAFYSSNLKKAIAVY
jgi:hypothetical protein